MMGHNREHIEPDEEAAFSPEVRAAIADLLRDIGPGPAMEVTTEDLGDHWMIRTRPRVGPPVRVEKDLRS
jgi:hypothetical protein